ncbi:hypothetical protein HHX48_14400 [Salinimonas sp. HHU 13199]|uniref:Tetratricopeptide repeat protein n=1 Tax=Salinimonas profundi TaxID=2729140 RepID=A0ABR8LNI1_9ALTE|nr:hypothetical protein [Salinimonas profundi]MBD3586933.1 hypothetical protein [Salinimonas profundi]
MSSIDKDIDQDKKHHKSTLIKLVAVTIATAVIAVALYLLVPLLSDKPDASASTDSDMTTDGQPTQQAEGLSDEEKRALQERLSLTKAQLSAISDAKRNWQPETVESLSNNLQDVYAQYGQSRFSAASDALDKIDASLLQFNTAYEQAFDSALETARLAYKNGHIHDARSAVTTALEVKPEDDKALALKARIDVFDKVQALYEQARVGKVENNLQKQYRALQEIVSLDPEQLNAKQALAQVERQMGEAAFSTLLAQALKAVEAKDYDRARQLLTQASKRKPDNAQIATLTARIEQEQHAAGQADAEAQIRIFAQADEWKTVSILAEKSIQSYPQSQVLQLARTNADKVLAARQSIAQYLARPERLADPRIRENAQRTIEQATEISVLSPSLKTSVGELESALSAFNAPLPVTVYSDNKTYIKVMGVGVVGQVDEKQISLKPGTYRFEGSREGFRSKIISVTVSASTSPLSVRLVCDEKI